MSPGEGSGGRAVLDRVPDPAKRHRDAMRGANAAGMHVHEADNERLTGEGRIFKQPDYRPNRVVATEVVVEPEMRNPHLAEVSEQGHTGSRRTGSKARPAVPEAPDIVDEHGLDTGHVNSPNGLTWRLEPRATTCSPASLRTSRPTRPRHV